MCCMTGLKNIIHLCKGIWANTVPLREYFSSDHVEGEYFEGEQYQKISVTPDIMDLHYLRSFKFEDLTFRGTVEFRSVCWVDFGGSHCGKSAA